MQVPNATHEAHPWVAARVVPDFRLLDVWALPVTGGRADFGRVLEVLLTSLDPADAGPVVRGLFAVRTLMGRVLRWDDGKPRPIPGARETSLRERLPEELRGSAAEPAIRGGFGFEPLYRTADEWAAEISNETVHGLLHLSWTPEHGDTYRARIAVYVKTRGRLGAAYLRLIDPFRHRLVYPRLLRQVGRAWAAEQRSQRSHR